MTETLQQKQTFPEPTTTSLDELPTGITEHFWEDWGPGKYGSEVLAYPTPSGTGYVLTGGDIEGDSYSTVFDISTEGERRGYTTMARDLLEPHGSPETTPHILYTKTEGDNEQQGLGRVRLELMNNVSQRLYGEPLSSDPDGETTENAAKIWQKLVLEGQAEQIEDGKEGPRWHFLA